MKSFVLSLEVLSLKQKKFFEKLGNKETKEWISRMGYNQIQSSYNGELDPGSGWTLAAGLTHASRGAAQK